MTPFKRVLVAVDGSANASRAADAAIDIAKRSNASLFVLSVVPNPVFTETTGTGVAAGSILKDYINMAKKSAEGFVKDAVGKAKEQELQVRGEIVENVPSVVQAINDYAEEWKVDLIVVGTRGLTGFKKMLMGSVSGGVLAHAPCSVLVVR